MQELINLLISGQNLMLLIVLSVFFLLGILLIALHLNMKNSGYLTKGEILGYVTRTKTKKDGEVKTRKRLVLKYTAPTGEEKKELGKDWSSTYEEKFSSGDEIDIKVIPNGKHDAVYLANNKTALIMGIILFAIPLATLFGKTKSIQSLGIALFIGVVLCFLVYMLITKVSNMHGAKDIAAKRDSFTDDEIQAL